MSPRPDQMTGPSPPENDTPFARALAARSISPFAAEAVEGLLDDLRTRMPTDDVSLELAALRLILYRLLTEHFDLPSLVALLTRVITVALHAARTSHHVRQQDAADLLDAISAILQELGAGR